jgi:hypothetical protein
VNVSHASSNLKASTFRHHLNNMHQTTSPVPTKFWTMERARVKGRKRTKSAGGEKVAPCPMVPPPKRALPLVAYTVAEPNARPCRCRALRAKKNRNRISNRPVTILARNPEGRLGWLVRSFPSPLSAPPVSYPSSPPTPLWPGRSPSVLCHINCDSTFTVQHTPPGFVPPRWKGWDKLPGAHAVS